MAIITDPSDLTSSNVIYHTDTKEIELITGGLLTDDGVTLQCVYSYTKEQWKLDPSLIRYSFPLDGITAEQFELVSGWNWATGTTINYIRDGGWALKDGAGVSQEEYMNLTTLGSFNDPLTDRAYYQQEVDGVGTTAVYAGPVNQAIKIYGDATHGNFDYRNYFKIFLREQGKIYDFYDLIDAQNLSDLTYKKYALPLSNAVDLKITADDITISGSTPYTNMSITWYDTPQTRTIGSGTYDFSIIVDGANGTAEQIYSYVAYQLRQLTDIDDGIGIVSGYTAEEMLEFVGDTLRTLSTSGGTQGIYIDNFLANDTNRLVFTDNTDTSRQFPYVAAGSILFNDNLVNDLDSTYWVFFTNGYDTTGATIINDNDGNPISGLTNASSEIPFSFDYDGNSQNGRTPGTDAPYTAVAIGLETGQYVKTTGSITRSTANVINFVAALERNYSNPI